MPFTEDGLELLSKAFEKTSIAIIDNSEVIKKANQEFVRLAKIIPVVLVLFMAMLSLGICWAVGSLIASATEASESRMAALTNRRADDLEQRIMSVNQNQTVNLEWPDRKEVIGAAASNAKARTAKPMPTMEDLQLIEAKKKTTKQ